MHKSALCHCAVSVCLLICLTFVYSVGMNNYVQNVFSIGWPRQTLWQYSESDRDPLTGTKIAIFDHAISGYGIGHWSSSSVINISTVKYR